MNRDRQSQLERETQAVFAALAQLLNERAPVYPGTLLTDSDTETAAETVSRLAQAWRERSL